MENPMRWMDLGSLIGFDHSAVLEWTHSVEMAMAVMVLQHFPPPSPSCGLVRPINLHRLQPIAWEPQTPACHQIKWISNSVKAPRLGGLESMQTFSTSLPLLTFLFAIWCFSFYLQLCPSSSVSPDLTQSPPPIVRLDPLKMELGWLRGSRYQWSVLASPLCRDCLNSGWIFN